MLGQGNVYYMQGMISRGPAITVLYGLVAVLHYSHSIIHFVFVSFVLCIILCTYPPYLVGVRLHNIIKTKFCFFEQCVACYY